MHIIADIGGTKMRLARTDDMQRFSEPLILDTPQDDDAFLGVFEHAVEKLAASDKVEAIVAGKPLWKRRDGLEEELRKRLPAPVSFENDTALVGLGEAHYGAGQGSQIFVYITVSTGVNGIRIVDGRVDTSTQGFEIGGQYLNLGSTVSWEEMISGTAISKRFGSHPKDLGKGNAVWEELAETLAYGLHNSILHWSPDRVAIGGSMLNEVGISVERTALHLKKIMRKFPRVPDIVHSKLGDVGGLYGGLALLRQKAAGESAPLKRLHS